MIFSPVNGVKPPGTNCNKRIFDLGIFYAKTFFSRGKGLDKEVIFLSFFLHLPTTITMTKTENRDFALIF